MFEKFAQPCFKPLCVLSCCSRVLTSLNMTTVFFSVSSHFERFEVGTLNRKIGVGFDSSDTSTFLLQTKEHQ
jgi:hypothetical protein